MNKYSKVLTYLVVFSLIYCVFMITYFLMSTSNQYENIVFSITDDDKIIIADKYLDDKDFADKLSRLAIEYKNEINKNEVTLEKINDLSKQINSKVDFLEEGMISAINKVSKSVVGIYVVPKEGINSINENSGSGFIIDQEGYVVTNYHVIKNAISQKNKDDKIVVIKMYGGTQFSIDPDNIFFDSLTDLAIFKIDGYNFTPPIKGDSDKVKVGSEVIALGNPLGLFDMSFEPTATKGIVSGKNIDFGLDEDFGSVYKNMIQTDASINPGNSGGPLLNRDGKIIGINTFIITGSEEYKGSVGLNFAIPINRAVKIIEELKINGKIDRKHTTGIELTDISPALKKIWNSYLEGIDKGVIVYDVEKKSAGEKAGLKIGDVILKVNNREINSVKDYDNAILEDEMKTGEYVELLILRNNESKVINLELEKRKFND